eukprot:gene50770-11574_t
MAAALARRALTIIMCDPVKGVGCDAMLSSVLSEICWGRWDASRWDEHLAKGDPDPEWKRQAAASWRIEAGPTTTPTMWPHSVGCGGRGVDRAKRRMEAGPTTEPQKGITYADLLEVTLGMAKADR